eukprot:Hpha_TRINITY_DN13921_c0_g1::TRINITY_DN13921_c0_g1_i1::g.35324::m.35324/K07238/TC.ZIP, zupT, ZRT3, ZIP2; zinc transporter, ZIP family
MSFTPVAAPPPSEDPDEHLTLAIILSLAAGLSTMIGGMTVFFPKLQKISEPKMLSAALALSGGVMLYVSFVEILVKANDSITLAIGKGHLISNGSDPEGETIDEELELGFTYPGHRLANLYTTLSFFGGMLVVALLDKLVHCIAPQQTHDPSDIQPPRNTPRRAVAPAEGMGRGQRNMSTESMGSASCGAVQVDITAEEMEEIEADPEKPSDEQKAEQERKGELKQMGLLTALALGLHNFPEGFATFIATLQDPALGIALVVAIAVHNIPEGICVAMPVYYATGSKWRALWWCFLSGISEPIGGIVGWAVLRTAFTDMVFGVSFAMVGGMMVFIVLHELLPMAHRHDPDNNHTTLLLVIGMVVIAASLIVFGFA